MQNYWVKLAEGYKQTLYNFSDLIMCEMQFVCPVLFLVIPFHKYKMSFFMREVAEHCDLQDF